MPIVYEHCVACHVEDGVGAFPLVDYEVVSIVEDVMKDVAVKHSMPPWLVEPSGACQSYRGVRALDAGEIATISAWAEAGGPEGAPRTPPAIAPVEPLAQVTHELDIGVDFTPALNPLATAVYRCFVADPGLERDGYVTDYLVRPGDRRMVHGVVIYALPSDEAADEALALDAADAIPGYECFGGPRVAGAAIVGAWAGGSPAVHYPAHTGIAVGAGTKAVIRIHYNTHNIITADRTRVDLTVAARVRSEARLFPVEVQDMALAPGLADAQATALVAAPSGELWGVFPHMHLLGKSMRLELVRGGETSCLADVPRWSFQFQELYQYRAPVALLPGDQLRVACSYDTFGQTVTITTGEDVDDEMCAAYVLVAGD
jgi:hypothetical protein